MLSSQKQAVNGLRKLKSPGQPGSEWCVSAVADGLAHEFDAPIGLLDPAGPVWRLRMGVRAEAFPSAEATLAAARSFGLIERDQVMVWRPDPEAGPLWLGLPAALTGSATMVAIVGFAAGPAAAEAHPWGPACPERALRGWGRAVADRLRAEAAARTAPSGSPSLADAAEMSLFDRLTRCLRVSDSPDRFQRMAAAALRDSLRVEAVAWVPSNPREPAVVAGAVAGMDIEAYRTLLPESRHEYLKISNEPVGQRIAGVRRAAVVTSGAETASGWFAVVNPLDDRPFSVAEIAQLQPIATLVGTQHNNARLYAELKELFFGVIRTLTSAIDAKDPYTSGHSERVARIAIRLAEELGMSSNKRSDLYLMGLLHDIGKIGVDDGVLKKDGPLTPEEFRMVQAHVRIGVHILSDLKKLHHLLPGVAYHHESIDGSGYPTGLAGDAIPLEARIIAVADAFDAMSSTRPYRRRLTAAQIDDVFHRGAGKQWDSRIVDALYSCRAELEHIRQKGIGESLNQVITETLGRPGSSVLSPE
jgi:HD-GYP domain-containing protein (c-di-GMP phosphodiesterase class II)